MSKSILSGLAEQSNDSAIWYTSFELPEEDRHPNQTQLVAFEIQRLRSSTKGLTKVLADLEVKTARWFIEGLYQAHHCVPKAALALPLSEAFHSRTETTSPPYSFGCIQRVIKAAQSLGWIDIVKGNHFLNGGQVTRIRAAGELARVFQAHPFGWAKMTTPAPAELIVMSSGKRKKIRRFVCLDEYSEIPTWQRNLNQINELLTSKCIHLDTTNENIRLATVSQAKKSSKEFTTPINFPKVSLRRIFARNRFDCGGRFYGGWWQYTPSAFRPYVSIDGEITVESDYSGMALNCLYALLNEQQGEGDPYDIGLNYLNESDPRRKLVKKYINAVLNDEHNKFRLSHDELCTLGISSSELHARVVRRHPKIAKHFNTGIGLHLQFVESEIAQNVMMSFLKDSEACLPIHDSFIVRHQQIEKLEYVMQESFQRQFNSKIKIKSENLLLGERMAAPNPELIPKGLPYKEQVNTFYRLHNSRVSRSFEYYAGWVIATQTPDEINAQYDEAVHWWQANRENVRAFINSAKER